MLFGVVGSRDSSDLKYMENLYREYYQLMASAAGKYTDSIQDREDTIQNAVVRLTKKISTLRKLDRPALASYIYRTVIHAAVDLQREKEKAAQWESPLEEPDWLSGGDLRPAENSILFSKKRREKIAALFPFSCCTLSLFFVYIIRKPSRQSFCSKVDKF